MKITLRTKLLLSYIALILVTLSLLEGFIKWQVVEHFNELYEAIRHHGFEFPDAADDFEPGLNFLEVLQNSIFYTVLAAGILAIFVSVLFTKYITEPIRDVIKATKGIAKGNYGQRVPKKSEDELGDLSESLNTMAQSLDDNRYLQRQLITNVSHELATPLTNVGGYLEALMDDVIPEQDRKETLKLMKEETDRLKTMVEEVRTLSMIQEPQFHVNKSKVDLKKLTEKVLKHCEASFKAAGVPLQAEYELKDHEFSLDPDRYHQIVLNLLNNALKHSKKDQAVDVDLSQDEKNVILKVTDHGVGIPEKELPYIFERFYRADPARSRQSGGIGIGLTIVKELVEAHGGKIRVESDEGKGAQFICSFPQ